MYIPGDCGNSLALSFKFNIPTPYIDKLINIIIYNYR